MLLKPITMVLKHLTCVVSSVTTKGNDTEPLDAAKHKPSVFAAVHGDPIISHGDLKHKRVERHTSGTDYGKYGSGTH